MMCVRTRTCIVDWIGLDWVSEFVDWVGLDLAKWTHVHLCRTCGRTFVSVIAVRSWLSWNSVAEFVSCTVTVVSGGSGNPRLPDPDRAWCRVGSRLRLLVHCIWHN